MNSISVVFLPPRAGVGVMCNFFAQSAENATLKDVEGNG